MTILSFKLDKLFIVLVPKLVVDVAGASINFPDEIEFVQTFLSIKSYSVIAMIGPLETNPLP
jgi:hypothetical protein